MRTQKVATVDGRELENPASGEKFPFYIFKIQFEIHPLKLREQVDMLDIAT